MRFRLLRCVAVLLMLVFCVGIQACSSSSVEQPLDREPGPFDAQLDLIERPQEVGAQLWQVMKEAMADRLGAAGAEQAQPHVPEDPRSCFGPHFQNYYSGQVQVAWYSDLSGDYTRDGRVDLDDFALWAENYGLSEPRRSVGTADWPDGSNDGRISFDDLAAIAGSYLARIDGFVLEEYSLAGTEAAWQPLEEYEREKQSSAARPVLVLEDLVAGRAYRVRPFADLTGGRAWGPASEEFTLPEEAAPQGLTASRGTYSDRIELRWYTTYWPDFSGSNPGSPDDFRIYRGTTPEGPWEAIFDTEWGASSYSDSDSLVPGQHYWYRISAVLYDGETEPSRPAEGWTSQVPAAPQGVQATDGTHGKRVTVSWEPVPAAQEYRVYRDYWDNQVAAVTDGASWDDTTLTDQQSHPYWVAAVNSYGLGQFSAADTGFLALGGVKGGYGGWLSPTGGPTNQNRSAHPGPVAPDALWSLDFGLTAEPPIVARDGSLVVHYGELACIEPDSSLRWSQDLPGWRSTDPAIDVDGYIYCASYDYNTEYAEIRKVRPADGAAVWTRQTEAPCRLLAPGYGGRLYAEIQRDDYGGEVALQALDESAQLLWELDSLKRSNPHQSYSRPAVSADNSLYLVAGTEGYTFELLAIDANGQIRWRRQAECSYPEMHVGEVSPMLLDNGNIVVGWNGPFVADTPSSCPAMVACYSPGGDLLWTYETDRDEIKCLAQAPGGRIYAVADYVVLCSLGSAQQARQASRTYDTWLYALEPDGALAWKYGLRYYWGDAAVDADGVVYVVSGFLELHAIKPDGELLWATPIEYCENEHAVLGPNRRLYLMMNWGELVALGPQ